MDTAKYSQRSPALVAVKAGAMPAARLARASIYVRNGSGFRLYRGAKTSFAEQDLHRLRESGVETIYLSTSDYCDLQDEIRSSIHETVADETLPVSQRFGLLNEVVRGELQQVFRSRNPQQAVEKSNTLSAYVVELILHEDFIASELSSVLHYDYGTFTHCANVAYYSVLLAEALGHSDPAELRRIGTGALLHDIGKLDVPEPILRKPGRLSASERETIRRHPSEGLKLLRAHQQLEFGQLMMVYQHHERLDGQGYPVQITGHEIHEWAKVCTVADVFEALTSNRPYRQPLNGAAALELMERDGGKAHDAEILRCWKEVIGKSLAASV